MPINCWSPRHFDVICERPSGARSWGTFAPFTYSNNHLLTDSGILCLSKDMFTENDLLAFPTNIG